MGWLAGAFIYYSANNTTNNKNIHNVIPVACYPNADTLKSVILKENKDKVLPKFFIKSFALMPNFYKK